MRVDAGLEAWSGALVERVEDRADAPAPRHDVSGSRSQRRVWNALRAIPAGQTGTYGEVAAAVGHPGAARAIGTVCAENPVAVPVPCRRVGSASCGVGAYAGDLRRKAALLERESRTAMHEFFAEARRRLPRRLQLPVRDIAHVVCEVPALALGIDRFVAAVAVELVRRLLRNPGAAGPGALEVCVDAVHVDVDRLGGLADLLRAPRSPDRGSPS